MVIPMINGMVKIENKVESATKATASSESRLKSEEKTTVFAAVGALAAITMDVKIVPRKPKRINAPKTTRGIAMSLKKIARINLLSFSTAKDLIFAI